LDDLPTFPLVQQRWLGFNFDQVTGTVFRGRELRIVHQNDLGPDVIRLGESDLHAVEDMGDVFAALEGEDEVIVGIRPSPDKLVRRFAVVSVRDSRKVDVAGTPGALRPYLRSLKSGRSTGRAVACGSAGRGNRKCHRTVGGCISSDGSHC
jgi:hypothetical protein